MTYPVFTNGTVLPASDLNAIGLWLVKSQTVGNAVSTVTVSSAFSSQYDAYKIMYVGGVGSTALNISLTLGASASTYNMGFPYVTYGAGAASGTSLASATSWGLAGTATTNSASLNFDVFGPFLSQYTRLMGLYVSDTEAGAYAGIHKTASSYTSFTLTPSTGTLTGGTISVYGYRK
jgi:hypothetical protein